MVKKKEIEQKGEDIAVDPSEPTTTPCSPQSILAEDSKGSTSMGLSSCTSTPTPEPNRARESVGSMSYTMEPCSHSDLIEELQKAHTKRLATLPNTREVDRVPLEKYGSSDMLIAPGTHNKC